MSNPPRYDIGDPTSSWIFPFAALELDRRRLGTPIGYEKVNEVATLLRNSVEPNIDSISWRVLRTVEAKGYPLDAMVDGLSRVEELSIRETNKLRDFCLALYYETTGVQNAWIFGYKHCVA